MGGYDENDRYNWFDANDICMVEGGYLASIHGKELQGDVLNVQEGLPF